VLPRFGTASVAEKLTDTKIKNLVPPATGQEEYPDTDVPGLRVRIGKSGKKTFILRKRVGGKPKNATIGAWHPIRFTMADARRKARQLVSDLEAGGDALAKVRAVPSSSLTVRTMAVDYIAYVRDEKQNRGWKETERVFNQNILPTLGDRLADTVGRGDITRLVDAQASPGAARSVYASLSAFYKWAMPRLDKLPANPARDAGKPATPKARKRVLNETELRALWKASDAEPFPWRAAIKLLILTAQRRDEVFAADRAEFDVAARLWTLPPERAKNGVAHLVPLSVAALTVFETIPQIGDATKLFPAQRGGAGHASGYSKLTARLRKAVEKDLGKPVPHWTLHDIRRSVATGMQRLGIRLEVTEAVLNHVSGSRAGIVGIYQLHDFAEEKRHALDAWASDVERIVTGENPGNAVALRTAGK
jgi:integrase